MTVASRLYAAMLKTGPAVTLDVEVRRDVAVRAPGDTVLLTDVYLARPGRPLPVILMRSPYGRGVYGTVARLFAERGYHAVVQSARGTFGSGGRIDFDAEAADGRATADWVTRQPWSDGTIGTFGGSYLGFTQLALARPQGPHPASAARDYSRTLVADTERAGPPDADTRRDIELASATLQRSLDVIAGALTGSRDGVYTRSSAIFDHAERRLEDHSRTVRPDQLAIRDLMSIDATMARMAEALGLSITGYDTVPAGPVSSGGMRVRGYVRDRGGTGSGLL